jgi:hypothetical protein
MKPERQAGIYEKPVAATGTSRLPYSQGEPSARSENCDPCDVEWVHANSARKIEELKDPPQNEQQTEN